MEESGYCLIEAIFNKFPIFLYSLIKNMHDGF